MKNFTLKLNLSKCLSGLLLGVLFILPGQTCGTSASRSLISRAIASARNHPIMTAAGVVGTGYLLYKWFHKKRAARPLPVVLPAPGLGDQPDDQVKNRISQEMRAMQRGALVTVQEEQKMIYDVIYDVTKGACLPKELVSLILDYHQSAFRGEEIHNFGNEAGWSYALVALPGNRFASGHVDGVVKIWNAKTKECINTVQLGVFLRDSTPTSLCVLNGSRLLAGTQGGDVYLLDLSAPQIIPQLVCKAGYGISSIVSISDKEVMFGTLGTVVDDPCPMIVNIETGKICRVRLPVGVASCTIMRLDDQRLVFGVRVATNRGWIGIIDAQVICNYDRQNGLVLREADFSKIMTSDDLDIQCMAVLHDKKLITGSTGIKERGQEPGAKIKIWDYETGSLLKTMQVTGLEGISAIVEFPDNTIIIATPYNMSAFSRDDQGNFTGVKRCIGQAPLLLLPQGLVTGRSSGAVRLIE